MSRDGNGVYSKPPGTTAVPNETITSSQFNSTIDDIVDDLNAARPLSAGGTGATSASAARTGLDVAQKQSSLTDTTADRTLLVGGFGIGGAAVSASDDLNSAVYGGIYQCTATTINTPAGTGPTGCTVIVARYSASNVQQFFFRRGTTPNDVGVYVRQMRESVWGSWAEVYSAARLIGTVAQSSGTPTGAVFERGSNANGEYVRFADGTQICTHRATFEFNSVNSLTYLWTFPAAFATRAVVSTDLPGSGDDYTGVSRTWPGVSTATNSTTSPTIAIWIVSGETISSGAAIANVGLQAVGRWF